MSRDAWSLPTQIERTNGGGLDVRDGLLRVEQACLLGFVAAALLHGAAVADLLLGSTVRRALRSVAIPIPVMTCRGLVLLLMQP